MKDKQKRIRDAYTLPPDILEKFNEKLKKTYINKSLLLEKLIIEWIENKK